MDASSAHASRSGLAGRVQASAWTPASTPNTSSDAWRPQAVASGGSSQTVIPKRSRSVVASSWAHSRPCSVLFPRNTDNLTHVEIYQIQHRTACHYCEQLVAISSTEKYAFLQETRSRPQSVVATAVHVANQVTAASSAERRQSMSPMSSLINGQKLAVCVRHCLNFSTGTHRSLTMRRTADAAVDRNRVELVCEVRS